MDINAINGQSPSRVAKHFLHLLDDVHRIHGLFLEEICTLRARVQELEAANATLAQGEPTTKALPPLPDVKGCAMYLVAADGRIWAWSNGARELYGYSVEEAVGRTWESLQAPALAHAEVPTGGNVAQARTSPRLRKDGTVFQVHPHCTPLLDETGRVTGQIRVEIPIGNPASMTSSGGVQP